MQECKGCRTAPKDEFPYMVWPDRRCAVIEKLVSGPGPTNKSDLDVGLGKKCKAKMEENEKETPPKRSCDFPPQPIN